MGILNKADFTAVNMGFEAMTSEFFDRSRLVARNSLFTDFKTSKNLITTINVFENFPVMRKWVGEKVFSDVRYSQVRGAVEAYEKSFELGRLESEADLMSGELGSRIQQAFSGTNAGDYDRIATNFLLSNPTSYDGTALFNASHPRAANGGTWSNISTTAFSGTQHRAVMVAGASLTDEGGEPWELEYDTLMVGPSLSFLAQEIVGSNQRIIATNNAGDETGTRVSASTIPNVNGLQMFTGGSMTVVVNLRLVGTNASRYFYFSTSSGARPVVMREYDSRAVAMTNLDSPERYARDVYQWSVEADLTLIAGVPQIAFFGNV